MKKLIFLVFLILLTVLSCNKEPQEEYYGKITGYDLRLCACCGGTLIIIDNATYRFDSLPSNSGIDLSKDTFPIYVVVKWHKKATQCMGDEIIIDKIRKQ